MRNISLWQLWGFAVTSLGGTLLHFLYDWAGKSLLAAPFSGVNESTWEHMKLFFFPAFLFAVLQSFFFREQTDFWCVKLRGTLIGLALIPALFYTYNGAVGKSPDWLNVTIFFIAAAIAYLYETRKLQKEGTKCAFPKLAFAALCLLGVSFVVLTFFSLPLPLFRDPLTGTYGIQ